MAGKANPQRRELVDFAPVLQNAAAEKLPVTMFINRPYMRLYGNIEYTPAGLPDPQYPDSPVQSECYTFVQSDGDATCSVVLEEIHHTVSILAHGEQRAVRVEIVFL